MNTIQLTNEEVDMITNCIIHQMSANREAISIIISTEAKVKIEENQKALHCLLTKLNK